MYHSIVRGLELVISGAFHFPRIIEEIIRDYALACAVIDIIYPDRIAVFVEGHFSESMKISGDGILIRVSSVVDAVKIVGFGLFHHGDLFVQLGIGYHIHCQRYLL